MFKVFQILPIQADSLESTMNKMLLKIRQECEATEDATPLSCSGGLANPLTEGFG